MMMPFICSCRNKKYIVYLVPVFCHTHVGLETFYEGEGDEMLPGCRVVHVLAARSYPCHRSPRHYGDRERVT